VLGNTSGMHNLTEFWDVLITPVLSKTVAHNACRARTLMLDEVCRRPRHAWHDSARSWGSRVLRVEGGCRYSVEGPVSGVRCVAGRQFPSHVLFNSTVFVQGLVLALTNMCICGCIAEPLVWRL
jgi:hypothetical protein